MAKNWEEIVDALAFGAATAKISNCLGLYLSPETVYIAETRYEGGKVSVDHLIRIPVPASEQKGPAGTGTATLNTDFLTDNTKLGALIRQSMSQVRWNSKDVIVTLSHHLALLRYFTMPAIEKRFWRAAVPMEAKKYIPIPFDSLSHDFQVIPQPPDAAGKPRQGALVAVTQRKNLANVTSLLENLGLNLVGMEVAPCSGLRLWEAMDAGARGKTFCQVHFDGGNIRILIADKGLPVFFRELFLGKEAALTDQRKVDLGGCVSFAQKQLGVGQLVQVRVSGAAGNIQQWRDAFAQELGLPVTALDTAASLGIKGGDWGGYAAIGASTRFLAPGAITLDLGRIGQVTEDERRTARNIFVLAAVAAAWFSIVGAFRQMDYQSKARELQKYRRDPEIEAVFAGKAQGDVDTLFRTMRQQIDSLSVLGDEKPARMVLLLKDVVDSLPERVWLTRIAIRRGMLKTLGGDDFEVSLSGNAMAATPRQEQELAFQFKDNLARSPVLGALCKDLQVSIVAAKSQPGAALVPAEQQKKLESRTTFTIRGMGARTR